jgi:hypothetical protein
VIVVQVAPLKKIEGDEKNGNQGNSATLDCRRKLVNIGNKQILLRFELCIPRYSFLLKSAALCNANAINFSVYT